MAQLGPYPIANQKAVRLAHAVGVALGLGQDATQQQVDDWIKTQCIALVRSVEKNEAVAALVDPAPIDFS